MKKISFAAKPSNHVSPEDWIGDKHTSAGGEPTKRLTIDVPRRLHKRIKSQCAIRGQNMADEIRKLLESLGVVNETALFVSKDGGRLTGTAISRSAKNLAKRCGLEHLTLHQFRHTCASDLLEGGVHLPEVQRVLGHQCISTTVRYLAIADPQRHKAVACHPINEILRNVAAQDKEGGKQ